jgi:hypothetical protein
MSGPSKYELEIKETETGVSMKITREPNDAPDDTYFGAAKQIEAIPSGGQDGLTRLQVIEAIVKKFGHYEKLGVYSKLHQYLDSTPGFLRMIVDEKIKTHEAFSIAPLDEQIYGRGKWTTSKF